MPAPHDLLTQLTDALNQAKQEEQERERDLAMAKRSFADAREETRKLECVLCLLQNKSDGITKKQAHSVVVSVLQQTGPLPEQKLTEEVTQELVKQQASRKGLSLMLKLLRKDFADTSGRWSIPEPTKRKA